MIDLPATAQKIASHPRQPGRFGGRWWLESPSGIVHLRWVRMGANGGPTARLAADTRTQAAACGMVTAPWASHDRNDFPGRLCLRCESIAARWEAHYLGEGE